MPRAGEIPCVGYSKGMSFGGTFCPRQFFKGPANSSCATCLAYACKITVSKIENNSCILRVITADLAKIIQKCSEYKTVLCKNAKSLGSAQLRA